MADSWDETKQAAQKIPHHLQDTWQVIHPSQNNLQIAQEPYEPILEDWKEYERYSTDWDRENPLHEPVEKEWKDWVRLIGLDPDTSEMER